MSNYQVTVICTCFNRKEKTLTAIRSLTENNKTVDFRFIVVDDGSSDGTKEALLSLSDISIRVVEGDGNLFWCGGMRKGIETFLNESPKEDGYVLLINDDVEFFEASIDRMFERLKDRRDYVVVGATCGSDGQFTYGMKQREVWYKKNVTKRVYPGEEEVLGETFNANCVLIPNAVIMKIGNMCPLYRHSLGDYDYGFQMTKNGIHLISSIDYVGVCDHNSSSGTWNDRSLSRRERLKKKESPKGSPGKEWWHFLFRNFGLFSAVRYTVIAYARILLGR